MKINSGISTLLIYTIVVFDHVDRWKCQDWRRFYLEPWLVSFPDPPPFYPQEFFKKLELPVFQFWFPGGGTGEGSGNETKSWYVTLISWRRQFWLGLFCYHIWLDSLIHTPGLSHSKWVWAQAPPQIKTVEAKYDHSKRYRNVKQAIEIMQLTAADP